MTEREAFEEWLATSTWTHNQPVPFSLWTAWQAGRAPLLKEIEQLNAALDAKITICGDERIHELNAKVAMMREAFNQLLDCESEIFSIGVAEAEHITESLSATEQDVTRWVNGVKADALEEAADAFDRKGWASGHDIIIGMMDKAKQLRGEV